MKNSQAMWREESVSVKHPSKGDGRREEGVECKYVLSMALSGSEIGLLSFHDLLDNIVVL